MAQTATQRTTGSTRFRGPTIIALRGAMSKGHEEKFGTSGPTGTGLDVALSLQVPTAQSANVWQVEQPDGTVVAGMDSTFGLMTGGNVNSRQYTTLVTISSANITGTSSGQLGNASGVVLVAAPASGYGLEFESALLSYTFNTAAYTGGGNVTVNLTGGSAITGVVSAANSIGNAASQVYQFVPLSTAAFAMTAGTGLSLVAASAFTQPGTAAGTVKVYVTYRVHLL